MHQLYMFKIWGLIPQKNDHISVEMARFGIAPAEVLSTGMFSMYIPFSCFTYFQSQFTSTVQRISPTSLASASYGIDV